MQSVASAETTARKDSLASSFVKGAQTYGHKSKRKTKSSQVAEQLVFDFESALLRGNLSGRIFGAIDYQEAISGASDNTTTGGAVIYGDFQPFDNKSTQNIFGESTNIEHGSVISKRDGFTHSHTSSLKNYQLVEDNFANRGGAKKRFKDNITAIRLLHELENSQKDATIEQQAILAKYIGWGGIPQAFDELNSDWQKEYAELKELLNGDDYHLAKASVLNAHYTSKTVIDGVYAGLRQLGFDEGTILEPALGTGNFVGLMPQDFKSTVYGVEIDNITGKIAKHLYPKTNIQIKGFEKTTFPDNFFDAVVTNVPFGSYKVFDQAYQKHDLFIHDYFILKSLDKLRPGGIAAIITSKGTLDKANNTVRNLYAKRANLLGAVRLPNTAFKENADTEVTADILFFQKPTVADISHSNTNWLNTSVDLNDVPLNQYFIDNPHMVLGTMKKGQSMYGSDNETYCEADQRDLKRAITQAITHLPQSVYEPVKNTKDIVEQKLLAEQTQIKNYCYGIVNGDIYLRVDSELIPQHIPFVHLHRLKAMIELRSQVRHILQMQIDGCSDETLNEAQEKLNNLYDGFKWKHGALNKKENKKLFREDADFTLLLSLENYDELTGNAIKTDIFSTRTIRKYTRPTSVGTALEALYISKNEIGKVDLELIGQLTNKSLDAVIVELEGHIYRNPATCDLENKYSGWETAAEYLSGNVREKLALAQNAIEYLPEFENNVRALQKAQPPPLSASDISVRMGVSWIDSNIYKLFICEKFRLGWRDRHNLKVEFNAFTGQWKVEMNGARTFESHSIYGTERVNGFRLYENGLNLQTPSVYDSVLDDDGKEKRVLNRPQTIAAREKLRKIQEEFKAWIFDEPQRRSSLVQIYNEKFNNLVLTKYDGSYLSFPEMNPLIELKQHQRDAVDRIVTSGNTLLHHVVGAGKTFEIAAAAMKLRQLKLAQKPMIVVPNHLVMQWANEFRTLYPNAKLLIATKKDFEKENRLKFVSRIATGDWDAVVMAMSSFERLPISAERQQRKIKEEIRNIENALDDLREKGEKRYTIKILQNNYR